MKFIIKNSEFFYIWSIRIGIVFIIISSLFNERRRIDRFRSALYDNIKLSTNQSIWKWIVMKLSENSFIKLLIPPKGSRIYKSKERLLINAGNSVSLTVEELFAIKITIALIFLLFNVAVIIVGIIPSFYTGIVKIITGISPTIMQSTKQIVDTSAEIINSTMGQSTKVMIDTNIMALKAKQSVLTNISSQLFRSCILTLLFYFMPDYIIYYHVKKVQQKFLEELNSLQNCLTLLMEAKTMSVYDIFQSLLPVSRYLKPYLMSCINEYNINPEKAINTLASRIGTKEFDTLARAMILMSTSEKNNTVQITESILSHHKKMRLIKLEEKIKKKPITLTILMILPLISFSIIWLTPWIYSLLQIIKINLSP